LARPFWGKGYATEAAEAALRVEFEFLELEDLVAFTAAGNCRSQALMQRLGMRHNGEFFEHPGVVAGHALRRHILYRLTRRD
jgi:RimJ/RimL family protein N-acetyltransferase